jgi:hypothetical protein
MHVSKLGYANPVGWLVLICFACTPALASVVTVPVNQLHQNDYPQKLDNANTTIAENGCTLTAQTMVINAALQREGLHEKKPDGSAGNTIQYTPDQVNTLLNDYRYEQNIYKKDADGNYVKENRKYVVERVETRNGWGVKIGADGKPVGSSTSINMGALHRAIEADTKNRSAEGKGLDNTRTYAPGFKDSPAVDDDKGTKVDDTFTFLLDQLEAGRPIVVRVAEKTHSVVVCSFHQEEGKPRGTGRYDIKDPWRNSDGNSIEWLDDEDYKNLIYGYGSNVYDAGGLAESFAVPSDAWIDPDYLYDPEFNPDEYGPQLIVPNHTPEPGTLVLLAMTGSVLLASRRLA